VLEHRGPGEESGAIGSDHPLAEIAGAWRPDKTGGKGAGIRYLDQPPRLFSRSKPGITAGQGKGGVSLARQSRQRPVLDRLPVELRRRIRRGLAEIVSRLVGSEPDRGQRGNHQEMSSVEHLRLTRLDRFRFGFSIDDLRIIVYTIIMIWNETKRRINLEKHQLDFADAGVVLSNRYRLVFEIVRNGEIRRQAFAYVAEVLTVLTVIWLPGQKQRIISFRRAHKNEREAYHAWLEKDFTD